MKKIKVDRKNYVRAILTDTLPYEVPLFFGNEVFYAAVSKDASLSGLHGVAKKLLLTEGEKRPFTYRIQKGSESFRTIGIPHPTAQLGFSKLYEDFDSYIENVCARSTYSLRFPAKVGSHFFQSQYVEDSTSTAQSTDADPVSFNSQRRWASSYFYYRRYGHIRKFFSSKEFSELESKYSRMMQLDIARCFESIYTHSLSWAVRGKEFSKRNKQRFFFESEFDKRMREANWGETNGILIGPEVSRIFAEAILQAIDVEIAGKIDQRRINCEIRRYVDDFFVFSNSEVELVDVKAMIEEVAANYGLHLNEKKTVISKRPLISRTSIARDRVIKLLNDLLRGTAAALDAEKPKHFSRKAATTIAQEVRNIAGLHGTENALLASPALAVIERGLSRLRQRVEGKAVNPTYGSRIVHAYLRIATTFFLMDIRASTSHKLSKIFLECSVINKTLGCGQLAFETTVQDSLNEAVHLAAQKGIHGPEIVNVLVAADAVCASRRAVAPGVLALALNLPKDRNLADRRLSYFDLTSVLYFARQYSSYSWMRSHAIGQAVDRVKGLGNRLHESAEETMLFFDFLSCPYIPSVEKRALFSFVCSVYGLQADPSGTHMEAVARVLAFTAWDGADDFKAMLQRKELQPAYDA